MVHVFCDEDTCKEKEAFTFTFTAGPSLKFSFDSPPSVTVPSNRPFKRRRALSDVDGDGVSWRKKRRLRLQFITSRLSRPFSQPASNIVDRGSSKLALWGARRRTPGKSVLRKAAIMNRVRMRMDAAKDFMRQEEERRIQRLSLKEIVVQKSRCHESLPPSPLGLSNYDALDLEDELSDEGHEGHEDGLDRISSIYSDFNIMNPDTSDSKGDDFLYLDALDGISPRYLPDTPPPPPQDDIVEILREDMQEQSYFMSFAD